MNEEKMTKIIKLDNKNFYFSQQCLCCNNTRRLPEGMTYCSTPWVCDECRDAIDFLKFLKQYNQELVKLIMKETGRNCL